MTTLVMAVVLFLAGFQPAPQTKALEPDPWQKVKDLKSGTDLKVYKIGVSKPLEVKFDDLGEESLIVATKKEQLAIPRDQIQKIEARPSGTKIEKQSSVTGPNSPNYKPPAASSPMERSNARNYPSGNEGSMSSGLSIGKGDFETVYQKNK